jgi:putative oxidoreductase
MNGHASHAATLLGRFLLALLFVVGGFSKIGGFDGIVGYIGSKGLPLPQLLAVGTIVLEIAAGLALIAGLKARWAAAALAVFTVLATFLFHNYWAMPEEQQRIQYLLFSKNIAVVGGLLMVVAFGPGRWSLDARQRA